MSALGTLAVLPLEVRTNIYTHLFRSTTVPFNLKIGFGMARAGEEPEPCKQRFLNRGLAILEVSKQVRAEALPLVTRHINVSLTNCFPPGNVEYRTKEFPQLKSNLARMEHVVITLGNTGYLYTGYLANHDFRCGSPLLIKQMFPVLRSMTILIGHNSHYRKDTWDMIGCGHDMTKSPVGSSWKGTLKDGHGQFLTWMNAFMHHRREELGHHVRVCLEMAMTSRKACRWEIRKDWEMRTEIVKRKDMMQL